MRSLAHLLLRVSYCYSQLLGLVRFEYVPRTGRVRLNRAITLYSLLANCLLVALVPLLYYARVLQSVYARGQHLHRLLYLGMMLVRMVGMYMPLIYNWRLRREFMSVIRAFQRLWRRHFCQWRLRPAKQQHFELCLLRKFCWGLLAEVSMWALTLDNLRHVLNWRMLLGVTVLTLLTHVLNLLLNHYYFAALNASWCYAALNVQLRTLLRTTRQLQHCHRNCNGVFSLRCCQLADELDTLAAVHHQLHMLVDRIHAISKVQSLGGLANIFISSVCLIFLGYSLVKFPPQMLGISSWGAVFLVCAIVGHHCDVRELMLIALDILKRYGEAAQLLRQHLSLPLLDVRLDRSFENFSLQLARNRLEVNQWGLFRFDKPMAFAMLAAAISNSIIIMQYQYVHK